MASDPRCVADKEDKAPENAPKGVRTAPTMHTSAGSSSSDHLRGKLQLGPWGDLHRSWLRHMCTRFQGSSGMSPHPCLCELTANPAQQAQCLRETSPPYEACCGIRGYL